jgi:hypothetical protein
LLARHSDGDHENQGSGTDHHPQRGEGETYFVTAKGVVGKTENFPKDQFGWTARRRGGSRHTDLDATRYRGKGAMTRILQVQPLEILTGG